MKKLKYLRLQVRYSGKTGKPVGVIGACWHLLRGTNRNDCLNEEEAKMFLKIEKWLNENLPNPPFYEDGNKQKAITWFKSGNTNNFIKKLDPLLNLLDKYKVPYDFVYTNNIGKIIYEDDYQIAVIDD